MKNNNILGTWQLISANLQIQNDTIPLFGKNPSGSLIFTEEMRFNVVLNDLDVPKFSSEDRSQGTCEELRAATKGALALYGTYKVDENGLRLSTCYWLIFPQLEWIGPEHPGT